MRRKVLLMLLFVISCSIHVTAQTYYFYYGEEKIPLTLNESKVCVTIPKEYDKTCERIRENVQALVTLRDQSFDSFLITRSEYEKLTSQDFWEEDAKYVILTPSYFSVNDNNREVFSTPYLSVKLKKEDDKDLLALYAEEYKLRIIVDGPLMPLTPLWYSLYVTLDSKKSPLECANELQESGDFVYAEPDLVPVNNDYLYDYTRVWNITTAKTDASSEIYDLQGRKLTSKPSSGIYIYRGQKKLAGSR